jgi:cardiolipin synthase (CMP-forming)
MVAIGVLIVGDAGPGILPVTTIGETLLWIAALLTLVTGYDYLQAGLRHMAAPPRAHTIDGRKSRNLA